MAPLRQCVGCGVGLDNGDRICGGCYAKSQQFHAEQRDLILDSYFPKRRTRKEG